jgi:hypothetical protein
MTLLSGVAAGLHLHAAAVVSVPPNMPVVTHQIQLFGVAKGDYYARTIPDAGKFYTFTNGKGQISPIGEADVQGYVALPGLLIMPTPVSGGGTPPTTPPIPVVVKATGQLFLSTPRGTLTLSLSAPSHDNATTLPPFFTFKITAASGLYKGDTGTGAVFITVDPASPPPPSSGTVIIGGLEHGTFNMVFAPLPPTATGTGSS